jgi:hypothetical protein
VALPGGSVLGQLLFGVVDLPQLVQVLAYEPP